MLFADRMLAYGHWLIVMQFVDIEAAIGTSDVALKMKAIAAMRPYTASECVPLLLQCLEDDAFILRSMACMGLGYKRSPDGLQALLKVLRFEADHNVRAEAANSVARYGGGQALQGLMDLYDRDDNWLVRTSILAALAAEEHISIESLEQLANQGCADPNETVRAAGQGLRLRLQQRRLEKLLS